VVPLTASNSEQEFPNEVELSLLDHLGELRKRLITSIVTILVLMLVALAFSGPLFSLIMSAVPEGIALNNFTMTGPFFMRIKLAFFTGLFFSLPVITWQAYAFIRPALKNEEDNTAKIFIFGGYILLVLALVFTYHALPFLIKSLLSWAPEQVENEADILKYVSNLLTIYVGFSMLFQVPLIILLTIVKGFVDVSFYTSNRKWVIVILLTLCAIFTPPDVFSQLLVFFPLYALFELALLLGRMLSGRKSCSD